MQQEEGANAVGDFAEAVTRAAARGLEGLGLYVVGVAVVFFAFGISVGVNFAAWSRFHCQP
eukprot:SAG25_NODE_1133_length_3837_cov_10.869984_6_plen_61_part_00